MTEGNMTAAIQEILLARELEPLSPIINAEVGAFMVFDEQYERGLGELLAASRLDDNYASTLMNLLRAYAGLGREQDALALMDRWRAAVSGNIMATGYGAMALPALGLEQEARAIFNEIASIAEETYVMPGLIGVLAASLGEMDLAFEYLQAALDERSLVVSWLRGPLLAEFRADPRYTELMESLGLEP
jgi:tetratricopeptide (TPR) repeat protein